MAAYDPRYSHRRAPSDISVEYVDRDFPPPGYREVRHEEPAHYQSDYLYTREHRDSSSNPSSHGRSRSHSTRRRADSGYSSGSSSLTSTSDKTSTKPKNDTLLAVTGALAGTALAVSAGKWAVDKARAKSQERSDDREVEKREEAHGGRSVSRGRRRYSVSEHRVSREYEDGTAVHHHYRSRSRVDDDHDDHVVDDREKQRDWEADEKRARHLKHKQVLMGGLAVVATVHAAHLTYRGHEARRDRRQAVKEGTIDAKEARRMERHAAVQDLESIGIAVLAIKNAVRTVKEAKDLGEERKELKEERLLGQRGEDKSPHLRPRAHSVGRRNRHNFVYTSDDDGA